MERQSFFMHMAHLGNFPLRRQPHQQVRDCGEHLGLVAQLPHQRHQGGPQVGVCQHALHQLSELSHRLLYPSQTDTM
jgi:hypothetical protein